MYMLILCNHVQHHIFYEHEFEQTLGYGEGQGKYGIPQSVQLQRVGHDLETEQQQISFFSIKLEKKHFQKKGMPKNRKK